MSVGHPEDMSLVAVAVDKDKSSQQAFKWALEKVINKGEIIVLVHVTTKAGEEEENAVMRDVVTPFRCFCKRKNVQCKDVVLQDTDVAKAIIEFVSQAAIEKLVVGAPSRAGFVRTFRTSDTTSNIAKGVPDFCTVYVIAKGKVASTRNAIRPAPPTSSFRAQMQNQSSIKANLANQPRSQAAKVHLPPGEPALDPHSLQDDRDSIKSPFNRGGVHNYNKRSYGEISIPESDISFVNPSRPSIDRSYPPRLSNVSDGFDRNIEMPRTSSKSSDSYTSGNEFLSLAQDSFPSQAILSDDVEAEMRRLRLELKQTMDMYSTACKEALTAKQTAKELHHWKMEEEHRIQEARLAEEAALAMVKKEREKCKVALEAAETSKRIAELEAQKRIIAEKHALKEFEEMKNTMGSFAHTELRYRRYTIEEIELATESFAENRKIGEGGYGPVYKCYLDHTLVAIKVLRPDAAQGRSQFHQEVEILSCIRHPNMVLLLGACPEYGCLVYEYMARGSLEDRLFRRGNTPPIPWQHRFRIAAEIGTGLLFLHQTKPEPLVHRDLKPANILLDRNYVSKISDVGLARLVPPSVADNVTQYRMTSAAGTFCYIDPEYQQTGMLGIKSDIYSLGIMLLQMVTGKPPMGLTHHVERSIERGKFEEMLDPTVPDWPVEEAMNLAKIALKCAELRRKDRPDLATVVLPELERLKAIGEENMQQCFLGSTFASSMHSQVSMLDVTSGLLPLQSGYDSLRSQSSALSTAGRQLSTA